MIGAPWCFVFFVCLIDVRIVVVVVDVVVVVVAERNVETVHLT